ncbi:MAG: ABC transporter ATP-binding protein, partial [Oscillospiraceae bacterium]|nr:ABC transporter ATP-binding protein [Oscillospiraceae bacterium]
MNTIPKMLAEFARGNKRFFLFSIIASAAAALLGFLTPLIVGFTIDSVIGAGDDASMPGLVMRLYDFLAARDFLRSELMLCTVLATVCAALAGVFNYLSRINMAKCAERLIGNMRIKLFRHTQSLPFEWHTKNLTGDIIQRCTSDVETTRRFVLSQLIEVIRTAILIAVALVIMFSINTVMALIATAFMPVILWYTIYFFRRIARKFHECDVAEGVLMVKVQENLTGVRVVRAFGREIYELEQFDKKNIDYSNKWISLGYTYGFFWGIGDIVSTMQLLMVLVFGSYFAATGTISVGDLLVFISYTLTMMWPLRLLGRILSDMSQTGVALRRIREIF